MAEVEVALVPPMVKSGGGVLTVCVNAAEVLAMNVASPEYFAVIECDPAVRVEVAKVACAVASRAPVPSVLVPSRNVTLPVGVPADALVTAAVKVTACPVVAGFAEDVTVVVVLAVATVTLCASAGETLLPKLVSP